MSARYLDRQLRETASEGIPHALLLKELGSKSFRIANIKEPRMRDANNRAFRVAARAALLETSRGLRLNHILVCQPICLVRRLSICKLIRRRFDRLPSEFFIGGY